MGQPERAGAFCVRDFFVQDGDGRRLAAVQYNHRTRGTLALDPPATLFRFVIDDEHPGTISPAAIGDYHASAAVDRAGS